MRKITMNRRENFIIVTNLGFLYKFRQIFKKKNVNFNLHSYYWQSNICCLAFFCIMKWTCLGITTWSRPVNSFELPCHFMGWDVRYLWTSVLRDWLYIAALPVEANCIIFDYSELLLCWPLRAVKPESLVYNFTQYIFFIFLLPNNCAFSDDFFKVLQRH